MTQTYRMESAGDAIVKVVRGTDVYTLTAYQPDCEEEIDIQLTRAEFLALLRGMQAIAE